MRQVCPGGIECVGLIYQSGQRPPTLLRNSWWWPLRGQREGKAVGGGEVGSGRWTVSDGIVLFASAVLLLSLCLVMIDDAGSSAGASSVATSTTSTLAQTPATHAPA